MLPEAYVQQLYSLAFCLTGNEVRAEELCLKVAKHLRRQGISCQRPDLMVQSACLLGRWVLREDPRLSSIPGGPVAGSSPGGVQASLNRLPLPQKLAVVLRDMGGLTYREMAPLFSGGEKAAARLVQEGRWTLRSWAGDQSLLPGGPGYRKND